MTGRPGDTAAAALATVAALLAAVTMVQSQAWLQAAVLLVLVVAAVGVGLRQVHAREPVILAGQVVAVAVATAWLFAAAATWYGIPTTATVVRIGQLLHEFGTTVYAAAAPLPSTQAVALAFALVAAVVAIAVDDIAVTRQAPAAAGLPLLAVFLTAAANSGAALSPFFFVAGAAAWLALLARHGRGVMRDWSRSVATPQAPAVAADLRTAASLGFGAAARRLGIGALALALLVPAVLPHPPTRFVLDGLARGPGPGPAKVGYSSTLDVSRSLQDGDTSELLRYRTTASTASPLRVVATSSYDGTSWNRPAPSLGRASRLELSAQVQRVERVVTVTDNTLDPPALATPQPLVAADFRGTSWSVDEGTSDVYVETRPESYATTYLEPTLTASLLRDGLDGQPGPDPLPSSRQLNLALRVDPRSESRIRAAAQEATQAAAATSYDSAMAIQEWLRDDTRFTYSLTLAAGSAGLDPISSFLESRTGYCVQFASAMIMMSRAKGIPARMAIGFLPGGQEASGEYVVAADDAHAWPELYFPGAGWVRFEPTPSVRTGTAPVWSLPETATTTPATPDATSTGSPDLPGRDLDQLDRGLDETTQIDQPLWDRLRFWFSDTSHVLLAGLLLGLLAAFVLPATALVVRLRRNRPGRHPDRVEAQWAGLTARLEDLGLPAPPGGTLRDWEEHYRRAAYLDEQAGKALDEVVSTVETARYARPGTTLLADVAPQIRAVTRAVARTRSVRERLRALLLPGEAVRWWRRAGQRASATASALASRIRSVTKRRHR